jgi:UPF0271 protein
MHARVDINCDMGESFGVYTIGRDEEVVRHITSANIACGFHASDPMTMDRTVRLCRKHHVMAGAHPGYPDRIGFGRRFMDISQEQLTHDVIYQVGALKGFLSLYGMPLQHVKLHGALYNDLVNKADLALQIVRTVGKTFDNPIFLTLATTKATALKKGGGKEGLRIALEAFPDRMYTDAGDLLSREQAGAVLKDPDLIAQRAVKMIKERGIESIHGRWLDLDIDTLCIHGDNPESIEAAKKIVAACAKEKFQIRPLGEFI